MFEVTHQFIYTHLLIRIISNNKSIVAYLHRITPSVATFYRIMNALGMRVEVVKPIM